MLRVVERVFGEGKLETPAGAADLRAGYQLAVYRDWQDKDGALTAGDFVIEGHVLASPDELRPLLFTADPLLLRLDDGRRVRVYVVSEEGAVSGADGAGLLEKDA
jgi:hypothetical protein